MKLENAYLCVEIAEKGAELTRILNKKTGAEILWNGDPKFWGTSFSDPVSKCRKNIWKYGADQGNTVSDFPAWICKRQ